MPRVKKEQEVEIQENTEEEVSEETIEGLEEDDGSHNRVGYNLVQVYNMAQKGAKFARRGWDKQLKEAYVTVHRGTSVLSFVRGNSSVPYTPSQEDAVTTDWHEVTIKE